MPLMPFMTMTSLQAANFNQLTEGEGSQLEPRLVIDGPQAGKYVLPTRVITDPAYAADVFQGAFAVLPQVAVDTELAWPPEEE